MIRNVLPAFTGIPRKPYCQNQIVVILRPNRKLQIIKQQEIFQISYIFVKDIGQGF